MSERGSRISCGNCVGACCQKFKAVLDEDELEHMEAAGTELRALIPPLKSRILKRNANWYMHPFKRRALARALSDNPRGQNEYNIEAQMLQPGEGLYVVDGKCGYLSEDGRCTDYENRPQACRSFRVGGLACRQSRESQGLWVPVEMSTRPTEARQTDVTVIQSPL